MEEETPFRVFSVRVFNDSKRFEDLRKAVVRLARVGCPDWQRLPEDEVLSELNLVANPSYLLLAGEWLLVDAAGVRISLGEISPSFSGGSRKENFRIVQRQVYRSAIRF